MVLRRRWRRLAAPAGRAPGRRAALYPLTSFIRAPRVRAAISLTRGGRFGRLFWARRLPAALPTGFYALSGGDFTQYWDLAHSPAAFAAPRSHLPPPATPGESRPARLCSRGAPARGAPGDPARPCRLRGHCGCRCTFPGLLVPACDPTAPRMRHASSTPATCAPPVPAAAPLRQTPALVGLAPGDMRPHCFACCPTLAVQAGRSLQPGDLPLLLTRSALRWHASDQTRTNASELLRYQVVFRHGQ